MIGGFHGRRGPAYLRLADAIEEAVDRGRLQASEKLPPERHLATELELSRSTVVAAYDLLEERGVVERRQGSGTRITGRATPLAGVHPFANPVFASLREGPSDLVDFAAAAPFGLETMPPEVLQLTAGDLEVAGPYGYAPMGIPPLREAIASYLSATGLPTESGQVIVTSGAQQALTLAGYLFGRESAPVAIEDPTYSGALEVFRALRSNLVPVPLDRHGPEPDRLAAAARDHGARLCYMVPDFHNPTGLQVPESRRRALARVADEHDLVVLEDAAFVELTLGARGQRPLATFSERGRVLTSGSLSKVAWPGLRVGWIRAEAPLFDALARAKSAADLGTSVVSQVIALRLLERIDELRHTARAGIRRRYDRLAALLRERLPGWSWDEPAGGLCLWARLPRGRASDYAAVAARYGVTVVSGDTLCIESDGDRYLRLPFVLPDPAMSDGVARLAAAWDAYQEMLR